MWLWPQARGDRKKVGRLREKGTRNRRTGPGGSHLAAGSPKWCKAAVPTAGDPLEQNPRYPQRGQGPSGTPELQALTRCGAPCQTLPVGCGFCYSTACHSSTLPPGGAREQAPPASQGRKPPRWCCCPVPSLELSHSASRQPLPAMPFTHQPSPALVVSPAPFLYPSARPTGTLPTLHTAHSSLYPALQTQFQVTSSGKPSGFSPPCPQTPGFSSHVLAVITVSRFSPCLCLPSPRVG